jgi:hypothetical protein
MRYGVLGFFARQSLFGATRHLDCGEAGNQLGLIPVGPVAPRLDRKIASNVALSPVPQAPPAKQRSDALTIVSSVPPDEVAGPARNVVTITLLGAMRDHRVRSRRATWRATNLSYFANVSLTMSQSNKTLAI